MAPALMVDGGAGEFLFRFLLGGDVELRGHRGWNMYQQRGDPRSPSFSPTRAREVLMIAGAGGAMRATGWRATAVRFQQFGEGGSYGIAR
jgi:hypothetical protein